MTIGGIDDHHCVEVTVGFVIGGTDDHHCVEVIVGFVDIGRIIDHHCLNSLFIICSQSIIVLILR